jgi:hypothetical protein
MVFGLFFLGLFIYFEGARADFCLFQYFQCYSDFACMAARVILIRLSAVELTNPLAARCGLLFYLTDDNHKFRIIYPARHSGDQRL